MGKKATNTKTKILDSAQALVLDRGFAATSIDAIQESAGISRGTFFYHFPSKDDLSRALIARYAEADHEFTERSMARAEKLVRDPVQQLLVFFSLHEELFEPERGLYPGCLFASYTYEAGLFDGETQAIVETSLRHWQEVVGAKFEEAIRAHPSASATDSKILADFAYGVFQGAFILSRLSKDQNLIVDQIRQLRVFIETVFGSGPKANADRVTSTATA